MKKLSYLNYLKENFTNWRRIYADEIKIFSPIAAYFGTMCLMFFIPEHTTWIVIAALFWLTPYLYYFIDSQRLQYAEWKEEQKQNEVQ